MVFGFPDNKSPSCSPVVEDGKASEETVSLMAIPGNAFYNIISIHHTLSLADQNFLKEFRWGSDNLCGDNQLLFRGSTYDKNFFLSC